MYSASLDEKQHESFYNACIDAYMRVFDRLGIGQDTFVTFASGGAFTKFSHEFQTICDAGEDTVYMNSDRSVVLNEEVMDDETLKELGVNRQDLKPVITAEVGNIFNFGTQKSEEMDFSYTGHDGKKQFVYLGSYGIGITRVMGVIAEKMSDEKGLVWHTNVAPYNVYLASIGDVSEQANKIYDDLVSAGIEVLYDDRDVRPGDKFADADLMGIPYRVIISSRSLESDSVELKERTSDKTTEVKLSEINNYFAKKQ
jgi:prolyl-tRNA synthetase